MAATVIDTAGGFPSPESLRGAGHIGSTVYVAPDRPGTSFAAKPVTRAAADRYRAAGMQLVSNWQYGKSGTSVGSDWIRGYQGGVDDARHALTLHFDAGGPGYCPIFFSVDEDVPLGDWNRVAVEYFRGAASVLGKQWVGVYGSSKVCAWAVEDDVVGYSTTPGKRWCWQTRAWSGTELEPTAVLYQRVIDTASSPGPKIDGITVDINDVLADDFGQWSINREPGQGAPPPTGGAAAIDYGITHRIPAGSDGDRSRDDFICLHTQEGGTGDAIALANYCAGAGVSYNVAVDDVNTVEMVPPNEAPWAALAANDVGWHLCFAGSFASWPESRWLSSDASDGLDENAMLWRGARAAAAAAQQFNIPIRWVGAITPAVNNWPDERGVCGHVAFGSRGGGHSDPGTGFPRDEFIRRMQSFLAPVPNLIDAEAKVAAAWIGARQTPEIKLYDGPTLIGAFSAFDNGHIYWRNGANSAFAIPHGGLFEAFALRNFEHGIGFPVLRHDVRSWGGVQSFEGGVLFVPRDADPAGFLVHGEIGKRYAAMGWETGPLGLPTSDERPVAGTDNITQTFEHGRLTWSPTGVVVNIEQTESKGK